MNLSDSPFDLVTGLPMHSLVIHAVVVFLPLAALGALAIVIKPSWSRPYGPLVVLGAVIATGAGFLAVESGEQLAGRVGWQSVATHQALGRWVPWLAAGLLVTTLILVWRDRVAGVRRGWRSDILGRIAAVAVIVIAVAGAVQTYRAGHSGSEAVWKDIVANTTPDSQPRPAEQ